MSKIKTGPDTHIFIDNPRCPLCGSPAEVYHRKELQDLFEGYCDRCGDVCIYQPAAEESRRLNKTHLISAWLRRRPVDEPPVILSKNDIERILKDTPNYSVPEKLDLALIQISSMTDEPGQRSRFDVSRDYPLVYAKSGNEAAFYVRQLAALGYVKEDTAIAHMTANGYLRLSDIQRASRQSAFVFVAMWFNPAMNNVYDQAIEPAVREAGYKAVRIDRVEHANRIDDEIIGRIRGSRFMVADFSGQRAGVYFEAGLMLGLGRTVIWMCKRSDMNDVHFDTRQYNFIDYENILEARKRLYDRIVAIEGEGPEPRPLE
jgi:hypothetical protein